MVLFDVLMSKHVFTVTFLALSYVLVKSHYKHLFNEGRSFTALELMSKKKSADCDLENKREKVLTDWHSSLDYNNAIIEDFLGQ